MPTYTQKPTAFSHKLKVVGFYFCGIPHTFHSEMLVLSYSFMVKYFHEASLFQIYLVWKLSCSLDNVKELEMNVTSNEFAEVLWES